MSVVDYYLFEYSHCRSFVVAMRLEIPVLETMTVHISKLSPLFSIFLLTVRSSGFYSGGRVPEDATAFAGRDLRFGYQHETICAFPGAYQLY